MLSKFFGQRRPASSVGEPIRGAALLPKWRKVVVPATGAPFSVRSIRTACRLVDAAEGGEVRLVYVMEVPRALAIQASLPGEDAQAQNVLADGLDHARLYGAPASTEVLRGREAAETLLRYVSQQGIDMMVLGARPDEVRGLPSTLTAELFERLSCPIVLDYISAET